MDIPLLTIAYILAGVLFTLIYLRTKDESGCFPTLYGEEIFGVVLLYPFIIFIIFINKLDAMNRRGDLL